MTFMMFGKINVLDHLAYVTCPISGPSIALAASARRPAAVCSPNFDQAAFTSGVAPARSYVVPGSVSS